MTPNGDLLSTQGDAINRSPDPAQVSEVVEFTPKGQFVAQFSDDSGLTPEQRAQRFIELLANPQVRAFVEAQLAATKPSAGALQ